VDERDRERERGGEWMRVDEREKVSVNVGKQDKREFGQNEFKKNREILPENSEIRKKDSDIDE
jgi:hypothetical protein